MYPQNQLKQAEQEISKGLKLKAANRLRNVINTYPDNMEARMRLRSYIMKPVFMTLPDFSGCLPSLHNSILKNVPPFTKQL